MWVTCYYCTLSVFKDNSNSKKAIFSGVTIDVSLKSFAFWAGYSDFILSLGSFSSMPKTIFNLDLILFLIPSTPLFAFGSLSGAFFLSSGVVFLFSWFWYHSFVYFWSFLFVFMSSGPPLPVFPLYLPNAFYNIGGIAYFLPDFLFYHISILYMWAAPPDLISTFFPFIQSRCSCFENFYTFFHLFFIVLFHSFLLKHKPSPAKPFSFTGEGLSYAYLPMFCTISASSCNNLTFWDFWSQPGQQPDVR